MSAKILIIIIYVIMIAISGYYVPEYNEELLRNLESLIAKTGGSSTAIITNSSF